VSLLVTGASGQFGRLVLSELLDVHGIPGEQIIATTRTPARLAEFARRGVRIRAADFRDPASLQNAFTGASRLLLISTTVDEMPFVDGIRLRLHAAAIDAASHAGVQHILYTSGPNPEPGTAAFWLADHYNTELALLNSGLAWTVLRHWEWPDWHLSMLWLRAVMTGYYFAGSGKGTSNHVTREDCASAAAAALLSHASVNRRYDMTGPRPLSIEEIMATLSDISGKSIRVEHGTPEEFEAHLLADGVDPLLVPVFGGYARAVRQGRYSGTTPDVEELTGRKPTTLRQFLARNATAILEAARRGESNPGTITHSR